MDYSTIFLGLMGLGTAFLGLTCLGVWKLVGTHTTDAAIPAAPAVPVPSRQLTPVPAISNELIAAISAAIAEDLGTDITGIRITSIKRV